MLIGEALLSHSYTLAGREYMYESYDGALSNMYYTFQILVNGCDCTILLDTLYTVTNTSMSCIIDKPLIKRFLLKSFIHFVAFTDTCNTYDYVSLCNMYDQLEVTLSANVTNSILFNSIPAKTRDNIHIFMAANVLKCCRFAANPPPALQVLNRSDEWNTWYPSSRGPSYSLTMV